MAGQRITKRLVDGLETTGAEYFVWDAELKGLGVRVTPAGSKAYVVKYRNGSGRSAAAKRTTIGLVGRLTPDEARGLAKKILGAVAHGRDPAGEKAEERRAVTVKALADDFLTDHVAAKRAARTAEEYRALLAKHVIKELGTRRAIDVTEADIARLHLKMKRTPYQANRVLAAVSSLYSWAGRLRRVPRELNPAKGIERYPEDRRERFLSTEELAALGAALREAETDGIPYEVNEAGPRAKHAAKPENRRTKLDPFAIAAIRLLIFTGARLSEILTLEWAHVDLQRGLLLLPTSKTGRKAIILNAPALAVLNSLERLGPFVIPGVDPGRPRADLKKPWRAISKRAGIDCRLHDLRHTHASYGAGAGLGLPIIGKLLGHTQAATTSRYAHLDSDPLKRASETIGSTIAAAMGDGPPAGNVTKLRGGRS
ncbi:MULTISPECIES: site-specific integrase [unclassified Chelatococcus]|uniref:site-specific integrase n=1 Tax=unclassified Chelatococcus TaxID=2638111 RepID=UPI001BCDF2FB|nr:MULTISPECIES: site-specific integrase [unclassified Chelatococcus]MBS7738966.1 site-specific integrase [Chelatococcus sp. HY11]MBX3543399.1 site-specific integrase [Chelatococcus sp.]MCO5076504.1 site-specific integrase [Chelatococcus sp.]